MVNFFIVGAPKCGTTTLYHFLNGHGQVDFGAMKEPHLFSSDLTLQGTTSPEDYADSYDYLNPESRVFGDASVMHLYSREAAKNILDYNKTAKILIMLRRPADFIVSYHHEQIYNNVEDRALLQDAWDMSEKRVAGVSVPPACPDAKLLDYKAVAAFDEQVQRYIDCFPPEQVRIGFVEDMQQREPEFIAALYAFLHVDPDGRFQLGRHGSAKAYKSTWQRQLIKLVTHPTVQRLWKASKHRFGVTRRFQLVQRMRRAATTTGEKIQISTALAADMEKHYAPHWTAVQTLARTHGLLDLHDDATQWR